MLDDVTFSIREGETLGITGRSGSGKTTLIRLLLRFYEPEDGDVRINGESIRRFDLESLRCSMGIVFQDNLIFNDSIRNNIEYGLAGMCSEKIIRAATVCCASDFIRAMPNRYGTVIGEQGKRLSGGERQRLAIARALAAEPAILVLYEGTSSLEIDQERIILKRIKEMRKGLITVIISHRLSAMESVDRVLTLDKGRIIETHPSLLAMTQIPAS